MENEVKPKIQFSIPTLFKGMDYMVFYAMVILICIGALMILSTSATVGLANYQDSYYFIKKHALFVFIGSCAFFFGLGLPHQVYKNFAGTGLVCATILVSLTLVPGLGVKLGGAKRWLDLGFFQLQPVEVLKFFVIVFISSMLENKKRAMKEFKKGILPVMLVLGIPLIILLIQPDFGNVILIAGVAGILLFMSHARLLHLCGLLAIGGVASAISLIVNPYQMGRIKNFLSPWADPLGKNYHIIQSFIAIGSGGLFGLGLGQSKLKFFYVPLQYSDFIFSILCEEGGFILAVTVILLFGVILFRGTRIASKADTEFGFYLALGLVTMLCLQAIINIGVVIGVIPITGIPLTFISFGGTSLIMSMYKMGVILNVSKYRKKAINDPNSK